MKRQDIRSRVQAFVDERQLISKADRMLVTLSGGADSVALLCIMLEMGYSCEAAHCNFHLRGEESMRDESFVRKLCEQKQIKLHVKDFDTDFYAESKKISIEMAARELRYDWFEDLMKEEQLDYIAVAHHSDDNVETILLNLLRGTGIDGLTGMKPINGHILRPLLGISHGDILDYLREIGQDFVTDSTNFLPNYKRNRIRLQLLPLMRELNPKAEEAILQAASSLSQYATLGDQSIAESIVRIMDTDGNISLLRLVQESSPELILFKLLHPKGFTSQQIQSILKGIHQQGKLFHSHTHKLLIDRGRLLISNCSIPYSVSPQIISEDGEYLFSGKKIICCHLQEKTILRRPDTATLDADKLRFPLQLRPTKPGDRFRPFGMKGTKLVSDYLTDRKRTLFQKQNQWVITSSDEIAWLIGETIAAPYAVTEKTSEVLILRVEPIQ